MRRVLLVAYHYPPRPGIGSVRAGGLGKYLPQFGWEPVVLTARLPEGPRPPGRVIETEYRDVLVDWKERLGLHATRGLHEQLGLSVSSVREPKRFHTRLIDWIKSALAYPDSQKAWVPLAVKAVGELARSEQVDAVLSTGPPHSCHLIGRKAKDILNCVWVADFRDLWTQNHYYSYGRLRRSLETHLEKRIAGAADALVTVSAPWAELLRKRFSELPVYWITNGFDHEEFPPGDQDLSKTFSITHTGQLYQGRRDPTPLFEVIGDLVRERVLPRSEVSLRFYGPVEPWLPTVASRCGLDGVVEVHGQVPRDVAIARQRESQLLLLVIGDRSPELVGHYPAKVFEYLGSRRPIMALGGPEGVITDLLRETRAGSHVQSRAQLRDLLIEAYTEFRCQGRVSYFGDESVICRYTHVEMVRRIAAILDQIFREGCNGG